MKKCIKIAFIAFCLTGMLFSAANAEHYVNGVEGIKAASVPPPGFYYRMYNAFYTADKLMDTEGEEKKELSLPNGLTLKDLDFDVKVFANVHRFIWISDYKILGADYGAHVIVPLINTDIEMSGSSGGNRISAVDDDKFALGDIFVEPFLLSWHGANYDAAFGLGAYMPTGDYDKTEAASPGKDMWTGMMSFGGTFYFDEEKTWSASILGRYEVHSEQTILDMSGKKELDITPGNDFHFEWGVAKTIAGVWDVGMAGYCQWQVTEDSGTGASENKDSVYAAGPEAVVFIPPVKLFVSLRSLWEFEAEDRPEGNITTLTFTKIF
ncbi:MAG: hypothetical protein BWK80_43670 [Desulfobacteraceae bacterium IS3]|nr:MAG: hypothetical protein BWK80_43670 [Desulfobacteraceae bacterium IS3]